MTLSASITRAFIHTRPLTLIPRAQIQKHSVRKFTVFGFYSKWSLSEVWCEVPVDGPGAGVWGVTQHHGGDTAGKSQPNVQILGFITNRLIKVNRPRSARSQKLPLEEGQTSFGVGQVMGGAYFITLEPDWLFHCNYGNFLHSCQSFLDRGGVHRGI